MRTELKCYCPICKKQMNYHDGYGRDQKCCSKNCYKEFDWRHTRSIIGLAYAPKIKPRKLKEV